MVGRDLEKKSFKETLNSNKIESNFFFVFQFLLLFTNYDGIENGMRV